MDGGLLTVTLGFVILDGGPGHPGKSTRGCAGGLEKFAKLIKAVGVTNEQERATPGCGNCRGA